MNKDHTYKRLNSQSLGDVIQQYIRQSGIQPKLDEATIISTWEEIVGKMIARHTEDLYLKNRKLYIKFDSAALKQEMMYAKSKLVEKINQAIGHEAIHEVVVL